ERTLPSRRFPDRFCSGLTRGPAVAIGPPGTFTHSSHSSWTSEQEIPDPVVGGRFEERRGPIDPPPVPPYTRNRVRRIHSAAARSSLSLIPHVNGSESHVIVCSHCPSLWTGCGDHGSA